MREQRDSFGESFVDAMLDRLGSGMVSGSQDAVGQLQLVIARALRRARSRSGARTRCVAAACCIVVVVRCGTCANFILESWNLLEERRVSRNEQLDSVLPAEILLQICRDIFASTRSSGFVRRGSSRGG